MLEEEEIFWIYSAWKS